MKIAELASAMDIKKPVDDINIKDIVYDSRQTRPGSLFVAIPGTQVDGHKFIDQALDRGAVAAVVERARPDLAGELAQLEVPNARKALAQASDTFFGQPSRKLRLVGVTGTNGKTTIAYLMESIFKHAGLKTGLIGTIEYKIDNKRYHTERTTPESLDLQRILAQMVSDGVQIAIMEVSSHALHLARVDQCRFAGRVFTNLSRDHLDFHSNIEDYFLSKARLFTDPAFGSGLRMINIDDAFGRRLVDMCDKDDTVTFGGSDGDYKLAQVKSSAVETSFMLNSSAASLAVKSRMVGDFNIVNLALAGASAFELGASEKSVSAGIWDVAGVPGRFEKIACGQNFQVFVDYAHTPDGLEKVLSTAKNLTGTKRLITVFGCGGDRDRGKRPEMGIIAGRLSDIAIVTSDNPRSEEPEEIIRDIIRGIPEEAAAELNVEVEREKAIKLAINTARKDDVVVIAGKGHEDYQILGDKVISFDDSVVARVALEEMLSGTN